MLFQQVLDRVLDYPDLERGTQSFDAAAVQERHDVIVIPAANWLQPRVDLSTLLRSVEATSLPCIVLGLGAQSGLRRGIPEVQDSVLRLLRVAAERSAGVSVRGDFSAEVLAHYGIDNVEVTGCPSLLWHRTPVSVHKPDTPPQRVAVSSSRGVPTEQAMDNPGEIHRVNRVLARYALATGTELIAQAELPDMLYPMGRVADDTFSERFPDYLERVYGTDDRAAIERYLTAHVTTFFDVDDWIEHLKGIDFLVGTRLHGTVAAMLAGTPALLIVHDARTQEMAEQAALATISTEAIDEGLDVAALYEQCDLEPFNRRAAAYFERFADYFARQGLRHRIGTPSPQV